MMNEKSRPLSLQVAEVVLQSGREWLKYWELDGGIQVRTIWTGQSTVRVARHEHGWVDEPEQEFVVTVTARPVHEPDLRTLLANLKDGPPDYGGRSSRPELDERSAHAWYVCDGRHDDRGCQFCDGGLGACTVCGGFDGSLTTVCPGVALSADQLDAVYAQKIDFGHDAAWWIRAAWAR